MNSIDEREREYAERTWPNDPEKQVAARLGYRAGAKSEHEKLTRWNDPKEKLPDSDKRVLIKIDEGFYDLTYYNDQFKFFYDSIIGWREVE